MHYRTLSLLIALTGLLFACSATGPVRFYSGPPLPKDQIAIVVVPAALTVRSIDGKKVDSPSKESGTYELELKPGYHIIAFRYELFWGSNESGRLVKSHEVGVDAVFAAGKNYTIQYKAPHSYDEALDLQTDFSATLVDMSSGQQYSSYEIHDLDALVAAKLGNTTAAAPTTTTVATPAATAPLSADAAVNEDPVKRLKFWWLMANPQQRQEFTKWMKTANESFAPAPSKTPDTAPPGTINGVKLKP